MPTRRNPLYRALRRRITPDAINLFRGLREIEDADLEDIWEDDGGRKREYSNASVELHILLGRLPAETNVMDVADPEAPDYCRRIHDYQGAHALRVALEELVT